MCHKLFSGDNLILSHTVMIIIDSKKQLHINEAGGKIEGFLLGLTHVFVKFYTTRHVSNSHSLSPVIDPDLQIREEGPVIQTLSERGGEGGGVPVSKNVFFGPQFGLKLKGGSLPWICHCSLPTKQPKIVDNIKHCSPFQTQTYLIRRKNHPLLLRPSPNRKVSKKGFLESERR